MRNELINCYDKTKICHLYVQKWKDYSLTWNTSEYGGVDSVRIPPTLLWKPDILMYNRFVQVSNFWLKLQQTSASAIYRSDKRGGCRYNYVQHPAPFSMATSPSLIVWLCLVYWKLWIFTGGVECRCVWKTRGSRRMSGRWLLDGDVRSPSGRPS